LHWPAPWFSILIVLLLDEPLFQPDAKIRLQVRAEIRKLQKELAITSIYVTHDQERGPHHFRSYRSHQGREDSTDWSTQGPLRTAGEIHSCDFIGINNLIAGEVKQVDEANRLMVVETRSV